MAPGETARRTMTRARRDPPSHTARHQWWVTSRQDGDNNSRRQATWPTLRLRPRLLRSGRLPATPELDENLLIMLPERGRGRVYPWAAMGEGERGQRHAEAALDRDAGFVAVN